MNPEYEKLAQIAYDTVLQTMLEGEQTHPGSEWKDKPITEHLMHEANHMTLYAEGDRSEDHMGHALTRLAIMKAREC